MIKTTLKTILSLALLNTLSVAKKEALIVGVNDYKGTKYDLSGVKKDVVRMEKLFKKWGFNVTVLKNEKSMYLEKYLNGYGSLSEDDKFIFYYSGHGSHTPDINGDEADGEDEALVLSNGKLDKLFLDDALFGYLNMVKAKKMLIFDSCHSGTAFKAFGDKPKPKNISSSNIHGVMKTKNFAVSGKAINKGQYIVFAAAQDSEQSLDTRNGGLFTNAFLNQFKNNGESKKFMNLRQNMEREIAKHCSYSNSKAHHPKLSASSSSLKYATLNSFFAKKVIKPTVQPTAEIATQPSISISGKRNFKENELLKFTIDTKGNKGYLTVLSIEDNKPFIMTQTKKAVKGVLRFQEDFDVGDEPIECYKACKGCQKEVSSVYIILSEKPLDNIFIMNKELNIGADKKPIGMRAFRKRTSQSFEPVIEQVEFIIY